MKKTALRTAESHFSNLPGYPFAAHYLYVNHPDYLPLRMHYLDEMKLDESSAKNVTVLLLHGCPTWSYLYRKVIATLLESESRGQSARIIAPDFIGCGKSDKLLHRADYSYDFYVDTLRQFITRLDLENIVLVCQDWGGPIGLRICSEMPRRFAAIIASNTLLPNAEAAPNGIDNWPGDTISNWVRYTQNASDISISQIVQGVTLATLPQAVLDAYDAPFPDRDYKQGMLSWPSLIPLSENSSGIRENRKTWQYLATSTIPFVTAFSDQDPSTAAWASVFQQRVNGAKNQAHHTIKQAAHMVQEDKGEELAAIIAHVLHTHPGCQR